MQVALFNNQTSRQKNRIQSDKATGQPHFSGAFTNAMNLISKPLQGLDANPLVGVIVLDILTAIAPNTIIDTIKRNAIQGFETFRRESSGLIINCILPGIAVIGAAFALKQKVMGKEFNHIPVHKVWANTKSIDDGLSTWKEVSNIKDKDKRIEAFIKKSFEKVQCDDKSFMKIGTETEKEQAFKAKNEAIEELIKEIKTPSKKEEKGIKGFFIKVKNAIPGFKDTPAEIDNKQLNKIHDKLAKAYGSSKNVIIQGADNKPLSTNMKNHIRNTFAFAHIFDDKSINSGNIDKFAKKMKTLVGNKTLITMAGVGILALSMQAINRIITEKTTGRKGYAGYKNHNGEKIQTPEDKAKLNIGKAISSAWFLTLGVLSMGKFGAKGQFDFAAPRTTMDQARILSLTTDIGRVNAADEKNELKDTTVRDTIIFFNLYMAGDYISKGLVEGCQMRHKRKTGEDLNLFNKPAPINEKNKFKKFYKKIGAWVKGKSIKSFEEIEGTFVQSTKKSKAEINQIRKNVVTASNLMGLIYSLGALGIAAPLLIARMTNKNMEKELAEAKKIKNGAYTSDSQKINREILTR